MEDNQVCRGFEILRTTRQLPLRSSAQLQEINGRGCIGFAWGKSDAVWVEPEQQPLPRSFMELLQGKDEEPTGLATSSSADNMPNELKRLVASSFDVFMRLCHQINAIQRQKGIGEDLNQTMGAASVAIVQASRKYRAALQKCIFEMEDRIEKQQTVLVAAAGGEDATQPTQTEEEEEQEEFVDLLKVSLAVWHLCEILFFHRRPKEDKSLSYEVAQWLQEHYAGARFEELEQTSSRLKALAVPEQDPQFWTTISSFVLMGCGKNAWSLLSFHSANRAASFSRSSGNSSSSSSPHTSVRGAFQSIQQLLVGMPGKSLIELRGMSFLNDSTAMKAGFVDWRDWYEAATEVLQSSEYIQKDTNLRRLMELLTVQSDDLLVKSCSFWYELMMAQLFLKKPKQVAHRFEFLMANCFHSLNQDMGSFDCIIMALFEYDVQSAIRDIHGMGFSWMAAHLCDLLTKANIVEDALTKTLDCSLREYFLLNYAIEMASCEGFWQMRVGYFEQCPRFGFSAICSLLAREQVTTEQKAHRLLASCRQLKMPIVSDPSSIALRSRLRRLKNVENSIAIRRAMGCVHKKAYGMGLWWLLKANQLDHVDEVCELILRDCETSQNLSFLHEAVEFLDAYHPAELPRKLDWLVKYRELQLVLEDVNSVQEMLSGGVSLVNEGDDCSRLALPNRLRFVRKEAAKRLAFLMNSHATVPKRLRGKLLEQATALLHGKSCMFTSEELMQVVAFVKQIQRGFDRRIYEQDVEFIKHARQIEQLVARNLADAFIDEALASHSPRKPVSAGSTEFGSRLHALSSLELPESAMDIDGDDEEDDDGGLNVLTR